MEDQGPQVTVGRTRLVLPPGVWKQALEEAGAPCVGCCEEGELHREGRAVWQGHSFLFILCLPCSSVLPDGFEMKATARMEDAVSMATELSTARQLQNGALWRRQMHRAAAELPPACQRGGWQSSGMSARAGDGGLRIGGTGLLISVDQSALSRERKLCAHPRLEIYQQDQIHFMCPLAQQGDFYVPEVKETEQKWRGLAEAVDAQVDGTDMWIYIDMDSHTLPPGNTDIKTLPGFLPDAAGVPLETKITDSSVLMGGG
ncbi:hypothetical protein P7K49_030498 [Saguinus oedipus]|uniref:Uncharacterized protein n=1 Tax=Saguinus oedipus TaxID=9490 RepID=A0ABQ9U2C2_SAGOE|nr:hypothetical protein P7K49_030498 [Saguinus oedipus]